MKFAKEIYNKFSDITEIYRSENDLKVKIIKLLQEKIPEVKFEIIKTHDTMYIDGVDIKRI